MTCELCETIVNFVKPFVDSKKDEVRKNPEHMTVYNVRYMYAYSGLQARAFSNHTCMMKCFHYNIHRTLHIQNAAD